jgi:hypothetical protein
VLDRLRAAAECVLRSHQIHTPRSPDLHIHHQEPRKRRTKTFRHGGRGGKGAHSGVGPWTSIPNPNRGLLHEAWVRVTAKRLRPPKTLPSAQDLPLEGHLDLISLISHFTSITTPELSRCCRRSRCMVLGAGCAGHLSDRGVCVWWLSRTRTAPPEATQHRCTSIISSVFPCSCLVDCIMCWWCTVSC